MPIGAYIRIGNALISAERASTALLVIRAAGHRSPFFGSTSCGRPDGAVADHIGREVPAVI